jgi:hypothetical protein
VTDIDKSLLYAQLTGGYAEFETTPTILANFQVIVNEIVHSRNRDRILISRRILQVANWRQ